MARRSKKRNRRRGSPEAKLTDDLLVEILRRLPAKSLCACKCVSTRWRGLISDPEHRKKLPQMLTGFFYMSFNTDRCPVVARHFTNVLRGEGPSISPSLRFLPLRYLNILDCCNGLLLCRIPKSTGPATFQYLVCNPATEKWFVLPESTWSADVPIARLGFEPAVSSHFHVFEFEEDEDGYVKEVQIYSSKAGAWSQKDSGWNIGLTICSGSRSIFFNGMLHLVTYEEVVAAVDVEAKTWRIIPMPYDDEYYPFTIDEAFIDLAQGNLYLATNISDNLTIWVLEDYGSEESEDWTLKHRVRYRRKFQLDVINSDNGCGLVSIYPEGNAIFCVDGDDKMLMSYQMDSKQSTLPVAHVLGHDCQGPYLPYVPNFLESLADGQ
ncbi:F-box protein At5g07610-like [Panicum virgatum]|uniref:F-box domain-containing protein n=1 Tax=Panicum virgatum TaxID=38727 RepID=A0A8T0WMI4_PANVG|nr:F-box protein At5g07610-like [Panicum virgatum]KAG2650252.1 hypothetical protein PVAP13_1NG224400 [Panicum virgatum]KAG2650253.1 hypothetical protein PVAP13_1NG224400 [Panicum virgatum]